MNLNNKVYINPNFNMPARNHTGTHNKMHVNPNFSQVLQNKNRIYVNPNFVNTNTSRIYGQSSAENYVHKDSHQSAIISTSITNAIQPNPSTQTITATQSGISKSRYSFVRTDTNSVLKSQENIKPKTTVQINKYKSVAISNYKISLDAAKTSQKKNYQPSCPLGNTKLLLPGKIKFTSISPQYNQIRHSEKKVFGGSKYVYKKPSADPPKLKSPNTKFKPIKRNLKKNNIPCPLFKKYGKCLRSIHGKCEFLHDKKHVSVCRKFLKGICHENDCLFSHEVTSNKMPTCYFYLKGICTRESCPYLHVKLNDKTKVCPEFLKGYCDKGEKCLNLHIGDHKIIKNNVKKSQSVYLSKNKNTGYVYKGKQLNKNILTKPCTKSEHSKTAEETQTTTDSRYYQEIVTPSEEINAAIEIIKPTRCKLGTLPSFIKL